MPQPPPAGYALERRGARRVYVRSDALTAATAVGFIDGRPALPADAHVRGRGSHAVYAPPGGPRVIWKACRRGGLAARLLGDRHFGEERFFRELEATASALRHGVRVGEILALAITRGAAGARRVEQLVRHEEGVRDAAAWLADGSVLLDDRRALIAAVADLVRRFHDLGFLHGDLNLRNILVRRSGGLRDGPAGERFEAILIDLDPPPGPRRGARTPEGNIVRLFRSWARLAVGRPLPRTDRMRFLLGWAGSATAARVCWRSAESAARRGGWLAPRAGARP